MKSASVQKTGLWKKRGQFGANGTYLSLFSDENSVIVSVPCPPRGLPLGVGASLLAISDAIASKLAPTIQFGFSTKKSLSKCHSTIRHFASATNYSTFAPFSTSSARRI